MSTMSNADKIQIRKVCAGLAAKKPTSFFFIVSFWFSENKTIGDELFIEMKHTVCPGSSDPPEKIF